MSDMFKVAAGTAWRISSRRFAVDKSTQGPSGHYTNITLTGSDRDAGVVNAGSVHRMQACSTERKEVCMPRTPAVSNGEVLGVRRHCARLRATAHLQPPASRPAGAVSLFSWCRCRTVGGRQGRNRERLLPCPCSVSSVQFSSSSFSFSVKKN